MTPRRPPVLAQTLLEWVDPANDALHGDNGDDLLAGGSEADTLIGDAGEHDAAEDEDRADSSHERTP